MSDILAENQEEFCLALMAGGLPMRSAAAIGGNGTQENLCRPVTVGAKDHGSNAVLQWREERLNGPDGLYDWCKAKGIPWDTLKSQALFTLHELAQPQYAVLLADLMAGTKSLETLTLNFCDAFERPSQAGRAPDERIRYAHNCLAILMRDATMPSSIHPKPAVPLPSLPPIGTEQMPIEVILQLVAPLAESLIAGLLKGVLTHVQQNGVPASPANPVPIPAAGGLALPPIDFVKLAEAIAAEMAKLGAKAA